MQTVSHWEIIGVYALSTRIYNFTKFPATWLTLKVWLTHSEHFLFFNPSLTKTSQELRMLSSVTINCQITKIVMVSGSQLSELLSVSQMSQVSGLSLLLLSIIVTIVIEILEKILEKS